MASVVPFRGLLYSASRVPELTPVVAPPYDVISPEQADVLRARDRHNVVHLDLPRGDGSARYTEAASLMKQWIQEGILEQDLRPAVYAMSQRYAARGMPERIRWGFIALLRIEDDDSGVVLPHERTMDAPRTDRMNLIAATRSQISPVFVLYADPADSIRAGLDPAIKRPADRWATDDGGVEVKLWRIQDTRILDELSRNLASHKIWIADGHHRYAAAREARDRLRAADRGGSRGSRPFEFLMAYFSNVDAPGLSILPYHRVVRGIESFDPAGLIRRAEETFDLKRFEFEGFNHRAEQLRRRLKEAGELGRPALGLYTGGTDFTVLLPRQGPPTGGDILAGLDVTILHRGILEGLLGISPEAQRAGALRYTHEVERAIDWIDAGEAQAALLLNPPPRHQMLSVAEAGLRMPQKSTYFYPKVPTGLVIHPFDPADEAVSPAGGASPGPS